MQSDHEKEAIEALVRARRAMRMRAAIDDAIAIAKELREHGILSALRGIRANAAESVARFEDAFDKINGGAS